MDRVVVRWAIGQNLCSIPGCMSPSGMGEPRVEPIIGDNRNHPQQSRIPWDIGDRLSTGHLPSFPPTSWLILRLRFDGCTGGVSNSRRIQMEVRKSVSRCDVIWPARLLSVGRDFLALRLQKGKNGETMA